VFQDKSSTSAVENVVQQTEALLRRLGDDGGPGAFVNLRRDFIERDVNGM
jgi:Ran-binding protein 9/10